MRHLTWLGGPFFPALFASLLPRSPITKARAAAGIVAGIGSVAFTALGGHRRAKLCPARQRSD